MRADEAAGLVPRDGWQRLSCADGSKGPRLCDWALIATAEGPGHHLLIRVPSSRERKASLRWRSSAAGRPAPSPCPSSPPWLARDGEIEDCLAEAKGEAGLDHYQVRRYRAWYRHATLAMLAHAFLAVTARAGDRAGDEAAPARWRPSCAGLRRRTCGGSTFQAGLAVSNGRNAAGPWSARPGQGAG
jgi:hypothetical protein